MGGDALEKVDWTLPGMEKFSADDIAFFKRDIADPDGGIVNSIHCLGWAYWPVRNKGYLDEQLLRVIADFIEIQNKPFWDEYDAYCAAQEPLTEKEQLCLEELGSMPTPTSSTTE